MTLFDTYTIIAAAIIVYIVIFKPKWARLDNSEWRLTYNGIFKQKKYQNKKLHEKKCREIVEEYFNKKFPSVRPDILRNITGKNMEFDMYNEELKLAFEYDGIAHAKYNKFFHKGDINNFYKQQERDKLKDNICKKVGIRLIRIPHTVKYNDLKQYIINKINN